MATTSNTYTGNGSNKLFSITFPYLDTSDIDVYLNGTLQTIITQYTFANATTVEFVAAPANGAVILLDRSTDDSALQATFFPGSSIKASDLNDDFDQVLYIAQETSNREVTATSTANAATAAAAGAVSTANTALSTANAAVSTANAATAAASNAVTTANAATVTAGNAVTTANTASTTAGNAVTTANAATATAGNAVTTANAAASDATAAVATANTASSNASSAVSTANTANSNASSAVSTANAANATANTANSNVSNAVTTANAAAVTANAAIVLADQAINLGSQSFGDLYLATAGAPGSKIMNLGDLTTGCASDYFTGESGSGSNYNCALGCASFSLGTL
jgi:hypothetical protein